MPFFSFTNLKFDTEAYGKPTSSCTECTYSLQESVCSESCYSCRKQFCKIATCIIYSAHYTEIWVICCGFYPRKYGILKMFLRIQNRLLGWIFYPNSGTCISVSVFIFGSLYLTPDVALWCFWCTLQHVGHFLLLAINLFSAHLKKYQYC